MDFSSLPPTLGVEGLAALLHAAPQTVKNNASRAPEKLPPPIRTGGRRLIWITADVMDWLQARRDGPAPTVTTHGSGRDATASAATSPRRRGRPTKAERLARRAAGGGQ